MASLLYTTLKTLFKFPIVILMLGDWRQGKTDTSLLLGHLAKKWGLISKIGSNIWTYKNPEVEHITDTGKLRTWLHADKKTKLFIFDEGLKHAYRRTAMSQMNVAIITEILPEISKGHGRMIVCSQIGKLDSDLIHPAFCRAIFIKKSKKLMVARSKHWRGERTFRNLPASPIKFDADRLAPFIHTKVSKKPDPKEMGLTYEIAEKYSKNWSMTAIKKDKGLHQEEVKRNIRKALKWFVENYDGSTEENGEENVYKSD